LFRIFQERAKPDKRDAHQPNHKIPNIHLITLIETQKWCDLWLEITNKSIQFAKRNFEIFPISESDLDANKIGINLKLINYFM
jgi:hypothetical protein